MTVVLVLAGGFVGAPLRYLADRWLRTRWPGPYPWGTFVVNLAGSFVLGLVAGLVREAGAPGWVLTLVGTGFCGALTTFSTFSLETVRLVEDGRTTLAAAYVVTSLVAGFSLCSLGWWLATLV